jgi:DNA-binding MarR family transcriptional regulator
MSREDLGALLSRATRRLLAEEEPVLAAHDLSMWSYIVLSRLATAPAETQLALARAIGYDKSRLIGLLDELEGDGLLAREPDPEDRRAKIVCLTPPGRSRQAQAQRDIRRMERRLLRGIDPADVDRLRRSLALLSEEGSTAVTGHRTEKQP